MSGSSCVNNLVAIKSVGCRTNQEEMETLRLQLEKEGFEITGFVSDADFVIVNTCAVTAGTESKTRRLLSSISSEAPDAQILVTGCLAQQKPDQLKEMTNVKWVVGNTFKSEILSIMRDNEGVFHEQFDRTKNDQLELDTIDVSSNISGSARTRFPVKIQEGCNFCCSYCIVPSLRGPSRSADKSVILKLCQNAITAGYKELILTGTHIGQYHSAENRNIVDLLDAISALDGEFRIRLSSLDPRDLSNELLLMVMENRRICKHLHVSLQSLSNDVLAKMNRPYADLELMIGKLIDFRNKMPHAGIGADLIVGHPGESERNFIETIDNAKRIGFSYAHIFRYSSRPGTAAAVLPDQVTESEKTHRSETLRNVIDESRGDFIKKMGGITEKIIVESDKPVRGLTSNYLHVEIPGFKASRNTWLDVLVKPDGDGRYYLAEPVM